MTNSINKVILIGNVGLKPEIRNTQKGIEVATFSIATTDRWKNKQSNDITNKTEWHKIVVFATGLINIIKEYLKKGNKVYIEGKLKTREYIDTISNSKKYVTEIVLTNYNSTLIILDTFKKDNLNNNVNKEIKKPNVTDNNNDDIPFE